MPRKDAYTGPISAQQQQDLVSEGIENFELPKNVVLKIAKSALPESAKLQKDTVLSLVKGSTVFINYLAATAHDVAHSKQHKSISASDVLKALELIEFGDLVDKLQGELIVYREQAKTKKGTSGSTTTITIPSASSAPTTNAKKPTTTTALTISSISTTGKASAKGKEKAGGGTAGLPPPFTNVPLGGPSASFAGAGSSISGMGVPMNVDDVGVGGEVVDEEVMDEEVVDEEGEEGVHEGVVDDDGNDDWGQRELDRMVDEEEELLKDSRGLDDHSIVEDHVV
ncbi:hypothetical protein K443DRAFT_675957 [Laccaria amethystina LaAM-08-1]|uniref:DNA polymerase epsilon subunit D n=1 Tax=Laccaria amethystina LaAM-08-1 TaxID=1095629 RepID=A0A0C9Y934_9AGAR|nr:hypothetical protein K443DRAFT_675957 [Laccaria amethystina LaAM-08-1]